MIEKHLTLSSYTLQHPFTADYSHFEEEIVDLIDKNNDVYEFRLADTELYEKIDGGGHLKQFKRMCSLCFMLYHNGKFIVLQKDKQLYTREDIAQIQMLQTSSGILVILRSNHFFNKKQLELQVGFIEDLNVPEGKILKVNFQAFILEEQMVQHDHFQKYVSQYGSTQYKIQKIINRCCLISDDKGQRFIFRLNVDNLAASVQKRIKYRKLDFQLHENYTVSSNFRDYLLVLNDKETYLLDCQHERIVLLKDLQSQSLDMHYLIYNNFAIIVTANNLSIFETIKGNKMDEINIDNILEEFQEGSTIILKEQIKKQLRYGLLYDNLKPKLTHFYLMDKQKISLFHFNINKLLERGFIKTIKENLQYLQSDEDKYHQNIMKTLNFRIKKLETLEKYLLQDLKTANFGNTVRFLINQQTIYVLNDGLSLFYHAVIGNITKLANNHQILAQLERDIIKICHRLITESNYQNQIANGLHILNGIYTNFRKYDPKQGLEKNKEAYTKLLETNRVTKLLKNQKKKKLFELSYELALKIKGYKYLQTLDFQKGK